jgi:hypothetical protein
VIPVGALEEDRRLAKSLVGVFQVDALYPLSAAEPLQAFAREFPYLIWPGFRHELFMDGMRGKIAGFLDIYHPVRKIFEEHVKDKAEPRIASTLYEWDADDPFSYVFLAQFGNYPAKEEIGKDYADLVLVSLRGERVRLNAADPLPGDAFRKLTPSALSSWDLESERRSFWGHPGFYVGDANDFDDLVNFWNLRAADIDLIFYDHGHAQRLDPSKTAYLEVLAKRAAGPAGWPDRISVWAKSRDGCNPRDFAPNTVGCTATSTTWNGSIVLPPLMYISEQSVLASVEENKARVPSISFQLPKKPFFADPELHSQQVVVSVRPIIDIARDSQATIKPPHIPELNEYYGREAHFIYNEARSEPEGLGIITDLTTDNLTIRALDSRQLIVKIFEAFGMAFNITSQLRDRDWAYRRSGLFGREDHQEGSIPVALTLQQMDTILSRDMIYSTAMNISPLATKIKPCETDFVLIEKADREDRVPLAIGECKSTKEITAEDVANLKQVADALPSQRINSYIIFSKTSPFTPEEIDRCRAAQDPYRARVILLSDRELEPYFVYERTEKEYEVRASAISLEDLAKATKDIYFEPRRKKQAAAVKPTIVTAPPE